MYRSTKEVLAAQPDQLLGHGSPAEAMALLSAERADSSLLSFYTSDSEQRKRTPRKPYR
ncbi:hypothetical protein [Paenibacillus mucilaginosus]|uniref:Uncharacterized protein n=3 Tax=Paenibacillus mucilaginosus TaxID=61624 RepID=H6NQD6_9BACL|nr:hypothetical protein [Paenibacillus mucilaginosus]AEI44917.1 hypothetical protein KNP414_06396 [Paenibacillus mucilaginosus KNP414]AFC32660.1 hypothetical protein PM3016_6007 [Paenibacillus mucilaginosus 3016]AFH64990.1 hypothetical protein B2K_30530 [Paenibacillus mucilaginosus K02]MCG7214957.1 hypothetical protein [Paenibacillus mucilaginosus]WDM26430.1 hypothetical protein KCX80_29015 [Paenibacillus mucilaginosus]